MDDLQREVSRNLGSREAEAAPRAGDRRRGGRALRAAGRASLDVVPTISALRERGDRIVEDVLRENAHRWTSLSDEDRERLGVLARAIVSRLLHEPTLRLKGASVDGDSYVYVQALRELFGLEPDGARWPAARDRAGAATSPRSTSAAAGATVDAADRHARQRARARPGALGGRPAGRRHRARRRSAPRGDAGERRVGDKSRLVKEIEEALLAGEVDLAVHSAKDVPGRAARRPRDRRRARARGRARRARGRGFARRSA